MRVLASLPLFAALLTAACASTQRVAGPLWLSGEPVAQGLDAPPVATVLRHAGPVHVRRPGAADGFRLPFHEKRARVRPGAAVIVGPGGRAELLWTRNATSIVLFGTGVAIVGDPLRDEPLARIERALGAQLDLTPGDRIVLPGGSELRGDPGQPSGPFLVEQRVGAVRVKNQSKLAGSVRYRDAVLDLLPGDVVDLPLLSDGAAPFERGAERASATIGRVDVTTRGTVRAEQSPGGIRLRAAEDAQVGVGGVFVRLKNGEAAVFSELSAPTSRADSTESVDSPGSPKE